MTSFEKWQAIRKAFHTYADAPSWLSGLAAYTVIRCTIEAWEFDEGRKIIKMLEWDGKDTQEQIRDVAAKLEQAAG